MLQDVTANRRLLKLNSFSMPYSTTEVVPFPKPNESPISGNLLDLDGLRNRRGLCFFALLLDPLVA